MMKTRNAPGQAGGRKQMSKNSYLLETEDAERINRSIGENVNGRVVLPLLGLPRKGDCRNLFRVLLTEEGKRLLSCAKTEEHFLSDAYSDYENFVELLCLLPSLVGSGYHRFVRLTLEALLDFTDIPAKEDAEALWKSSLPLLRDGAFDDLLSPFTVKRSVDVSPSVYPSKENLLQYESLGAYISAYRGSTKGASMVWLDLSALDFALPDPYHAEQGFLLVKEGSGDARGQAYLSSQLLRVTGEICTANGIPLILYGTFASSVARDLIQYLDRTDRKPRLFYAMSWGDGQALARDFDALEDSGLITELCGILPQRLPYCSAAALSEGLRLSAMRYPLGRLLFVAEGTTEAEVRIGYEGFKRVLSGILADSVQKLEISEKEAVALGERILTAEAF